MKTGQTRQTLGIALQTLLFAAVVTGGNAFPRRSVSCGDDLFSEGVVSAVEISVSEQELASLRERPRQDISCEVKIEGTVFHNAKVHLKGAGTFQPIDEKPSFTIKIEGLQGISKLHLNSSLEDGTFVQEKLGSEFFAAAGIPAPRVGHARVRVNGVDRGLYVLKEGFGPEFLARSFSEGHGKVYDKETLQQKPPLAVEEDKFVTFLAAEVLLCHWDGYGLANNNFRVCSDAKTGRCHFLPAGMDQLFGNPNFPLNPDMTGPLARRLLESAEGKERFAMRVAELGATFDGPRMARRAEEIAGELRAAVSSAEFAEIREATEDLCARVLERGRFVREKVQAFTAVTH